MESIKPYETDGVISTGVGTLTKANLAADLAYNKQNRCRLSPVSPRASADAGGDLVLTGVRKTYGPVTVLDVPSLVFRGGEVVALVGENGAGKSTMMGIIAGAVQPDGGTVAIAGHELRRRQTHAAQELGITMVSQEFPLVGQLSVTENLLLGQRPGTRRVRVDWRAMDDAARSMLKRVGLEVPLRRRVDSLSVAQRQLIEIAKALGRGSASSDPR